MSSAAPAVFPASPSTAKDQYAPPAGLAAANVDSSTYEAGAADPMGFWAAQARRLCVEDVTARDAHPTIFLILGPSCLTQSLADRVDDCFPAEPSGSSCGL